MRSAQQRLRNLWHKLWIRTFASEYERARHFAPRISVPAESRRSAGYPSQYGQDQYVAQTLFPDQQSRVFVDIGAHDGRTFSNTWALEHLHGWTGIAIEPNPEVFARLQLSRKCHLFQGCISDVGGELEFRVCRGPAEMLSGLVDHYHPDHVNRIERESLDSEKLEIIRVPSVTLTSLLDRFGVTSVDYLSLDTEGAEYAILSSIDLQACKIRVIDVENNYADPRIFHLLRKAGYRLVSILGCDEFYAHESMSVGR